VARESRPPEALDCNAAAESRICPYAGTDNHSVPAAAREWLINLSVACNAVVAVNRQGADDYQ